MAVAAAANSRRRSTEARRAGGWAARAHPGAGTSAGTPRQGTRAGHSIKSARPSGATEGPSGAADGSSGNASVRGLFG